MSPDDRPTGFRSDVIEVNGVGLHVVHNGHAYAGSPIADDRQPLLCLHGFPEFWRCWEKTAIELADEHLIVMPDQRGFGKSAAPVGAHQYTARKLSRDMFELAKSMFGRRSFNLAGHDFGASIGYAMIFGSPDLIDRFIVVNGAHPVCLQEALLDNPAQASASQYFHTVRAPGAGVGAAADDFRPMFDFLQRHSSHQWLTETTKTRFREAWEGPERLEAMFNWYRSSPIVVPVPGATLPQAPLYGASNEAFRVPMPHTLIWGLADTTLLPDVRHRLPEFCDRLAVIEVPGADHWILHTHPTEVARHLRQALV